MPAGPQGINVQFQLVEEGTLTVKKKLSKF